MRLIELGECVGKLDEVSRAEEEKVALLFKGFVVASGIFAVKMDPHETPWGVGAAFVGIRSCTVQPYAVASGYGIGFVFIGYDTASVQYYEEEIGA